MNLGERLTRLRKCKGLSQEQLAEEFNLTRQTISKWELNQSAPDIDSLVKLSDYFGVTTDYLIKGERTNVVSRSDIEFSQSNISACVEVPANRNNLHKGYFYLGIVTMSVCLIGIIAFVVCSALNPWTAMIGNRTYDGLLGFLIGTKTLWFFIILSVLFFCGGLSTAYGIVKSLDTKK